MSAINEKPKNLWSPPQDAGQNSAIGYLSSGNIFLKVAGTVTS